MSSPATHYARSGDASIAYQTVGEGPCDLVVIAGPASHLEVIWEEPRTARTLRTMAHFARLIMFDRRGTGLSDPVSEPPTLEQQADDLTAVLNAAGSEQVSIIGGSDLGLGPVCRHLSRAGDGAGAQRSGGGWRTHARRTQPEAVLDAIENDWGNGTLVSVFAPATPTIPTSCSGGGACSARRSVPAWPAS